MVIQRWQSVMLLLAVACMVVYIFMPVEVSDLNMSQSRYVVDPKSNPGLWLPAAVSAVLYFVDIFLFKNFKNQLWTLFAANVGAITAGFLLVWATISSTLAWSLVFPLVALVFGLMARHMIVKDMKKLRSYDRLR